MVAILRYVRCTLYTVHCTAYSTVVVVSCRGLRSCVVRVVVGDREGEGDGDGEGEGGCRGVRVVATIKFRWDLRRQCPRMSTRQSRVRHAAQLHCSRRPSSRVVRVDFPQRLRRWCNQQQNKKKNNKSNKKNQQQQPTSVIYLFLLVLVLLLQCAFRV